MNPAVERVKYIAAVVLREAMGAAGWIGAAMILGAAVVSETLPEPDRNA